MPCDAGARPRGSCRRADVVDLVLVQRQEGAVRERAGRNRFAQRLDTGSFHRVAIEVHLAAAGHRAGTERVAHSRHVRTQLPVAQIERGRRMGDLVRRQSKRCVQQPVHELEAPRAAGAHAAKTFVDAGDHRAVADR